MYHPYPTLSVAGGRKSEGSCSSKPAAARLNFFTIRSSAGDPSSAYSLYQRLTLTVVVLWTTHRLCLPNVFLHDSLHSLEFCAHVRACSYGCDCFGKGTWSVRVGKEALLDCDRALGLSALLKLKIKLCVSFTSFRLLLVCEITHILKPLLWVVAVLCLREGALSAGAIRRCCSSSCCSSSPVPSKRVGST